MTDFLPTQEPGPGPTDAPLATWQSYSAYTTAIYDYTTTITRIAYDTAGTEAPSLDVETIIEETTSIGYTVVNKPLLYTGPFPAPNLGTLFTTHGQVFRPTPTASATNAASTSVASGSKGTQGSSPSQPISASSPVVTASPRPSQQNAGSNAVNSQQGGESQTVGNGIGSSQNNGSGESQSVNQSGNGTGNQAGQNSQQQSSGNTPTAGGSGNGANSASNLNSVATSTPQPSTSLPPSSSSPSNNSNASAGSVNASQASVSASNAAISASQASLNASNAAQSNSASVQSASAASAASSASALSASASSQSVSAASSIIPSSAASPTSTLGGLSPSNLSSHGLSGGQIAGIVLGSIFGLLLLLLLLGLVLSRRRRRAASSGVGAESGTAAGGSGIGRKLSDKWASGFSNKGAGDYAALGTGAGLAGLGMAAAGGRGAHNLNSNDWEEDRLSGGDGSGFFVVGGKRHGGRESAGGPFGSDTDAGIGSLAGFGAGIAAVLTGKRKGRNSGKSLEGDHQAVPTSSREADMADEDEGAFMSDEDGDPNSEARGLMSFGDIGDTSEMTQAGPSGWTQTPTRSGWGTAAAGAGGAVLGEGAISAARRGKRRNRDDSNDESNWMAGGISAPNRAAAARQGQNYSSGSSPYQNRPVHSYHDMADSPRSSRTERMPSFSGTFGDGDLSTTSPFDEEALLGTGAAGVGLAALAAGHRDSGHSQVGSDYGPDDSHSSFLSQDTPLLGPGAYQTRDQTRATGTLGTAYSHQNRLPTIRSVGEFGERGSSLAPSTSKSGTRGTGSGSGTGTGTGSGSGYGSGRNVPLYSSSAGPSAAGLQQFYTPTESPGINLDPFQDRSQLASIPSDYRGGDVASTTALGSVAGFLGGLLPNLGGWTKSEDTNYDPLVDDQARERIRPLAVGQERGRENNTAETQSYRGSVYNNGSKFSHKQPSPTGSAQSSVPNSVPSHTSPDEEDEEQRGVAFDEDTTAGGYTASVSNQSRDLSSGNSRSESRRSGQTMSTRFTRGTNSESNSNSQSNSGTSSSLRRNEDSSSGSGSTGAASYNPSHLARQSTSSTRGVGNSSGTSRLASRGGNTSSSSSRIRRRREDGAAQTTLDSDGRSSRATAGDGEDLPRVSFDPGLEDVQEGSTEGALPVGNYYPSESLGAAVTRQAERDQQDQGFTYPDLTLPSVAPLSWRQSPRVESMSQRANANLMQQRPSSSLYDSFTQMHGASSPPPRPPPRQYRLSRIESEASQNEHHEANQEEEGNDSDRLWI